MKPHFDRTRKFANAAAERTATGSILFMVAAMSTMLLWIFIMEGVLSPGPTIPDPGSLVARVPLPTEQQNKMNQSPKAVTLYVYPRDADRLARTLELDVSRHGGWTISNPNDRDLTFAVSQRYVDRIQLLVESGGIRRVQPAYALWVATSFPKPNLELGGVEPDTTLRINLRYPVAAHPATLPMLAATAIIVPATFLVLLICAIVYR